MQLSLHADYALRVLIYLGTHPDRVISTQEISEAYGISRNHLVRVVQTLAEHSYVLVQPGRSGGVKLARDPKTITLGDVVRQVEPNLRLVECFDPKTNKCPIVSACVLQGMLREALQAFVVSMNRYTLAEVLTTTAQPKLVQIFARVTTGSRTSSVS